MGCQQRAGLQLWGLRVKMGREPVNLSSAAASFSSQSFLTLLALSRCVMSLSLSFWSSQRAPTPGCSTIRLEQPKKAPRAAQNMSFLHHGSLETVWHIRGDTASGICSSACFPLPRLQASSCRLPLWFIVLLHFWAPGKCFCPINFDLEVSMFPRRKINHSSREERAPHNLLPCLGPPSPAFHLLFPPTVPFPLLLRGKRGW